MAPFVSKTFTNEGLKLVFLCPNTPRIVGWVEPHPRGYVAVRSLGHAQGEMSEPFSEANAALQHLRDNLATHGGACACKCVPV
jgi:hypothetical protein